MHVLPLRAPRVLPLLVTCACMPLAHADVRRCETPDGRTVYTDRACEDLGAVERVRRAAAGDGTPSQSLHRGQCSRTVEELALEVGMAIDRRDVNALAGLYHWPGMSTSGGYSVMERLEAIVQRPLVDVRALYPEVQPAVPAAPAAAQQAGTTPPPPARPSPPSAAELMRRRTPWWPREADPAPTQAQPVPETGPTEPPPHPERPRTPYALQVDQTLGNGSTPSRTVFGLRRHLGCWWISL